MWEAPGGECQKRHGARLWCPKILFIRHSYALVSGGGVAFFLFSSVGRVLPPCGHLAGARAHERTHKRTHALIEKLNFSRYRKQQELGDLLKTLILANTINLIGANKIY